MATDFVKDISRFVWSFANPETPNFASKILWRDILLFGWWLQTQSGDKNIHVLKLLNLVSINLLSCKDALAQAAPNGAGCRRVP